MKSHMKCPVDLDHVLAVAPFIIFTQDENLHYTWISRGAMGQPESWFIGKSDKDILPAGLQSKVMSYKQDVLKTGEECYYEIGVPADDETIWYDVNVKPVYNKDRMICGVAGIAVDVTDRKNKEKQIRLLMRELSHRSKNILSVVQALAHQTAKNSKDKDDFIQKFGDRLSALAMSHSMLIEESWGAIDLEGLIRSQLTHYRDLIGSQIDIKGPPVKLGADLAQNIGLAIYELATNAVKYGALSVPEGKVVISWESHESKNGDERIKMFWIESGGPLVKPPTHRGFGYVVIERTVARSVNGDVSMKYDPDGIKWSLDFRNLKKDEEEK